MNDLVYLAVRESKPAKSYGLRKWIPLVSLLRKDVASNGPAWLPLVLVLGAISAVAYVDHFVVSISLVYLYILPLAVGAICPIPHTVTAYPLRVGSLMHATFGVKEAFGAEPNAPSTSCYLRTWKDCRRFGPKRNTAK